MPDITAPVSQLSSEAEKAPTDFNDFEKWRQTGELPAAAPEDKGKPAPDAQPAPTPKDGKTAEDPGASDNEQDRDEKGKFKPKPDAEVSPGVQKRIDKAIAKQREAERRAEDAERRAQEIEQRQTGKDKPAADADPEPKIDDFESAEKYWQALGAHAARQKIKAQQKRDADARVHQEAQKEFDSARSRWKESEAEVRAEHDDYDEVIEKTSDIVLPGYALLEILHSDEQAKLQYYLATHPAELKELATVPAHRIGREIAKLEAKLTKNPAPDPAPKVTRAPLPPSPVNGRARQTVDPTDPKTDFNDFEKSRNEDLAKRGKRY